MRKRELQEYVGEEYELRLRATRVEVEIVGVNGMARLWDRTFKVLPVGAPEGTEPTLVQPPGLLIYDLTKKAEQSPYGHGRKLGDVLHTFHQNGLDGRGCFQMTNSGNGIGHYTTCGNPAKMKVNARKDEKVLPMLAVPHGFTHHAYFCGVHDPVKRNAKRKEKDDARRAQWKREDEENARRERERKENARRAAAYDGLVAALAAIIDGEGGDPRELARAALVSAGELKASPPA